MPLHSAKMANFEVCSSAKTQKSKHLENNSISPLNKTIIYHTLSHLSNSKLNEIMVLKKTAHYLRI